jgi:hypothetical protein
MHAGQDLDQGRLAGPVLPDECVDLARVELDRYVLEGMDAGECLAGVGKSQKRCARAAGDLGIRGRGSAGGL